MLYTYKFRYDQILRNSTENIYKEMIKNEITNNSSTKIFSVNFPEPPTRTNDSIEFFIGKTHKTHLAVITFNSCTDKAENKQKVKSRHTLSCRNSLFPKQKRPYTTYCAYTSAQSSRRGGLSNVNT